MSRRIELNLQSEGLWIFPFILRQAQDERKNPQALMFLPTVFHIEPKNQLRCAVDRSC